MELLLYCPEPAEGSLLAGLLIGTAAKLREPLQIQICNTRCGFLEQGKTGTGRILLFAVRGPESVTLAAKIHEACLGNWQVWFRDLDFSLFAYHLEAAYFGLLPVREGQVLDALTSCQNFTWERAPACRRMAKCRGGPTVGCKDIKNKKQSGRFQGAWK